VVTIRILVKKLPKVPGCYCFQGHCEGDGNSTQFILSKKGQVKAYTGGQSERRLDLRNSNNSLSLSLHTHILGIIPFYSLWSIHMQCSTMGIFPLQIPVSNPLSNLSVHEHLSAHVCMGKSQGRTLIGQLCITCPIPTRTMKNKASKVPTTLARGGVLRLEETESPQEGGLVCHTKIINQSKSGGQSSLNWLTLQASWSFPLPGTRVGILQGCPSPECTIHVVGTPCNDLPGCLYW
jgi:hypothetical protein